jgi:Uma2 family endonuclease
MAVTDVASQTKTRWTAARYLQWSKPDDGNLYEVLNGQLIMAAAPILRHQEVSGNIYELLRAFARSKKLGKVYDAPIDVVLGDDVVEPDIVFISHERKEIMSRERITGAPDLIVEVLSLSTSAHDLRYKWDLYARSGVREYWVVNPEAETVEVLMLADGIYQRHALGEKEGAVTSKVLEGLSVAMRDVSAE